MHGVILLNLLPAILAAFVLVLSAVYVSRRRRERPWTVVGIVILLTSAHWMACSAIAEVQTDPAARLLWEKIGFAGSTAISTAWLVFAIRYAGRQQWLTPNRIRALTIVPLLSVILSFTDESHGLMWHGVNGATYAAYGNLELARTPFGWAYLIYCYVQLLIGAYVLIRMFAHSRPLYRWQTSVLAGAAGLSLTASLLDSFGWRPIPYLKLTPLALAVSGVVVSWTIVLLRRSDVIPAARGAILDIIHDAVLVLDDHNRIMEVNPAAQRLLQSEGDYVGQPLEQLWPDWTAVSASAALKGPDAVEATWVRPESGRIYDVGVSILSDGQRRVISRVVVLRDITARVEAEEKIRASLAEKEVLLKEINHRVKNNLQIISSLLSLQSNTTQDPDVLNILRESRDRVRSMALIHERLYHSSDLAQVDFGDYILNLTSYLFRSYSVDPHRVSLRTEVEDVSLTLDKAVPCGLILNELISNALKYAFPQGKTGEVSVRIERTPSHLIRLEVADNGVGLPSGVDCSQKTTIGLQLVDGLTRQLRGALERNTQAGVGYAITFPENDRLI